MTDVFAIQEQIATAVAEELRIELLGAEQPPPEQRQPTNNMDAYRLYLQGRREWHQRTSASLERAKVLFEQALELDPEFAQAWSGLADTYNFLSSYGNMPLAESVEKATAAAHKALELAPDLAEAHASLGLIYSDTLRYELAGQSFARAIELKPGFAMAHMWLGSVLMWIDPQRGLEERRIAAELDPLSPIAVQLYGEALAKTGQVEEARRQYIKVTEFAPDFPTVHLDLAGLALAEPDYAGTIAHLRTANKLDPGRASTLSMIGDVYLLLGDVDHARTWLDKAMAVGPDQVRVIVSELQLLLFERDFGAAQALIDRKLKPTGDLVLMNSYASVITYENGDYARTAELIQGIFDGVAALQPSSQEGIFISDETMYGALYLASALQRDGNNAEGQRIARDLLAYLDDTAERRPLSGEHRYVQAAARVIVGNLDRAVETLLEMGEQGYGGYRQVERDPLYEPIRGEVGFQLVLERMRGNAEAALQRIADLPI